ncbi:MAG: helix-turn-helix domain-containing protein [Flavobacteriales bacterium]
MKHFKNIQHLSNFYEIPNKHPLIDIKKYETVDHKKIIKNEALTFDFYTISFVKNFNGFIQIGKTKFEGDNGVLHFIKPGQQYTCNATNPWKGYQVLIHPNIFKKHFSYKEINAYDFFSYQVNESLLLTQKEEQLVENILSMAFHEFNKFEDDFSIPIILSYLGTLLNLAERFYARQFDNRKELGNQLTETFYLLLNNYYDNNEEVKQPTVSYFAKKLNVTPNYLSDTIKHHSNQSALTIIHDFVIKKANEQLLQTKKTVSEISYLLGFEYPNYFSRLYKQKMGKSPSEYRKSVKSI